MEHELFSFHYVCTLLALNDMILAILLLDTYTHQNSLHPQNEGGCEMMLIFVQRFDFPVQPPLVLFCADLGAVIIH